jgi:hypothetical protein
MPNPIQEVRFGLYSILQKNPNAIYCQKAPYPPHQRQKHQRDKASEKPFGIVHFYLRTEEKEKQFLSVDMGIHKLHWDRKRLQDASTIS